MKKSDLIITILLFIITLFVVMDYTKDNKEHNCEYKFRWESFQEYKNIWFN